MKTTLNRAALTCQLLCAVMLLMVACPSAMASRKLEWFDDESKQLRTPSLPLLEDPKAPQKWVWKPWPPKNPTSSWRFPALGDLAAQIFEVIVWVALGLGFICLLVYVLRSIQNQESNVAAAVPAGHEQDAIQMQKLAELPFATGSPRGNLLDAAREMYQQGNYDRAILFLFGYQLLQLDRHQRIRLWKGKTNRQYLREANQDAWLSDLLAETIDAFEGSYFGNHAVSRERFESCWERMDKFHQQLGTSA